MDDTQQHLHDMDEIEFIIERDDDEQPEVDSPNRPTKAKKHRKWIGYLLTALGLVALMILSLVIYNFWKDNHTKKLTFSPTPAENIELLQQPVVADNGNVEYKIDSPASDSKVVFTTDSLLGVSLNLYELCGLEATIVFDEPKLKDKSVMLYCRSADFRKDDGSFIGSFVVDGEDYTMDCSNDSVPHGYMAILGSRSVIGISDNDEVKKFIIENGGSYFQQYFLVSNGMVLQDNLNALGGTTRRCAIGWKKQTKTMPDRMFFIASRDEVSAWDFANALREYGFTNAIYITGGSDYCYYRDEEGTRHDIGDVANYPYKKWTGVPWLVFKKLKRS